MTFTAAVGSRGVVGVRPGCLYGANPRQYDCVSGVTPRWPGGRQWINLAARREDLRLPRAAQRRDSGSHGLVNMRS